MDPGITRGDMPDLDLDLLVVDNEDPSEEDLRKLLGSLGSAPNAAPEGGEA
jgi:hypothetical protein